MKVIQRRWNKYLGMLILLSLIVLCSQSVQAQMLSPSRPIKKNMTHSACENFMCIAKMGAGFNTCQSNLECANLSQDIYAGQPLDQNNQKVFHFSPSGNILNEISDASLPQYSGFGGSLGIIPDVTGDKIDDLGIGTYNTDISGNDNPGKVSVYSSSGQFLWMVEGTELWQHLGYAIDGIPDVNGDGFGDIVATDYFTITFPSQIHVYNGRTGQLIWEKPAGVSTTATFGLAVSGLDDVNNDGRGDVLVGAHGYGAVPGRVDIYSGKNGDLLWSQEGENLNDKFGSSVSNIPDIDNDLVGDFIVGAARVDCSLGENCGKIYVFSGKTKTLSLTLTGSQSSAFFGAKVGGVPDIDGDGKGDILITDEPGDGPPQKGRVYVYSSQGNLLWSVEAEKPFQKFGMDIAGLRDIDGDEKGDVLIGAYGFSGTSLANSGKVYLYSGAGGNLLWSHEGDSIGGGLGLSVAGPRQF
ncbi:MAG: hypothetical protein Q7S13_03990 [Candidatus Omnitrophota bacterium]|nr:hypothetical protein [Candidatus Omnitrophota bacterium]